jgi:hypothetical protein
MKTEKKLLQEMGNYHLKEDHCDGADDYVLIALRNCHTDQDSMLVGPGSRNSASSASCLLFFLTY